MNDIQNAPHDYLSTACHHGLHERCRKSCKFCGVACSCECHRLIAAAGTMAGDCQLVPKEPTDEMLKSGCLALESQEARDAIMAALLSADQHAIGRAKMRLRYKSMLAAFNGRE